MEFTETTKHGVTLITNKPKIDESRMRLLESRIGCGLPEDYREFLMLHNGGRPIERGFQFVMRNGKHSNSVIDWFLSLHDGEASNLESCLENLEDRIPPDVLPIARDPFGNVVLIGLRGGARGKVYFWDHEEEPDSQPDWSNIDRIADSFDAFMSGLKPSP